MESDEESVSALIGPTITIRGTVTGSQGLLIIQGSVEGVIEHDQIVVIEKGGSVDADVRAREVHIDGIAKGNIHGIERAKISASGTVEGNIYSKLFSVEEGARIKGKVVMKSGAEPVEIKPLASSRPMAARKARRATAQGATDETPSDASAS